MAFESIDIELLRQSLSACRDSLAEEETRELTSAIRCSSWQGKAKDNLTSSLDRLVNIRYKELRDEYTKYENIIDDIRQYKELQKENEVLETQRICAQAEENTTQMLEIDKTIRNNKDKMDTLEIKVNSSI